MDAFAQLALMTKAKHVFESKSDDTFLSFPVLQPYCYPPERLKFMKAGGEATARDLGDLSEFSRITNQIPRGVLAPVGEGEYLWEVYHEVLLTGQVSSGTMSADEKGKYDQARAFLYTRGSEGLRADSEAVTAYKQCRDAHIEALENYKSQQFTAESSDDPAVKAQWQETDEPALRAAIARAKQEWLTRGRLAEVESAMQIEREYGARAPSLTWDDWQGSFVKDIDMGTDANVMPYAITGFAPYDLFDRGSWPRFTLSNAEMTRLAREAPPELLNVFGSNLANPEIESVSFEYRSVAVIRPWFRPALFKSRFWRLGARAEALSDGGDPPAGRCPAYITALVFARNVAIQRRRQPHVHATAENPRKLLELGPRILELHRMGRHVAHGPVSPDVQPEPAVLLPPARALRADTFRMTMAAQPLTATLAASAGVRLEAYSFSRTNEVAMPPPPPAPSTPTPSAARTEIAILAFICKRVRRCPDPDPALSWL